METVDISRKLVRDLHREYAQAPVDNPQDGAVRAGMYYAMIILGV